jgi:amidophosphoribosyltransferase
MMEREAREKCGLFGTFGRADAAEKTYLGLHALQHRGQESAGIAVADGKQITCHTGMGLVSEVFRPKHLRKLAGSHMAIGHVRYSTTGGSRIENAQPLVRTYSRGQIAVAHNGNLVNAGALRDLYEAEGHIFTSTTDTEIILHMLAKPDHLDRPDPLAHVLRRIRGSFSLLFLTPDSIIAVRDPHGNRPLMVGRFSDGTWCFASETCAFDLVGAAPVREVAPGEIVTVDAAGLRSRFFVEPGTFTPAHCVFEHVYFAKPSSSVFGENVHLSRKRMGARLAEESPCEADVVVAVPDSGNSAAVGYSARSGLPLEIGFVRSHYVGRTFLHPSQDQRNLSVQLKLQVVREAVAGKRVVVVEDSIVRGTTTRGKMGALRDAGAREIHLRISCPPIRHPCHYGIDFPTRDELVAHGRSVEDVRRYLGVDSLAYLSLEGMLSCVDRPASHYCSACWSGKYPIPVDADSADKLSLERSPAANPAGAATATERKPTERAIPEPVEV